MTPIVEDYRGAWMVPHLLSVDATAELLSISRRGVYRLMERGELQSVRIGGRTLFDPIDVQVLIARGKTRAKT